MVSKRLRFVTILGLLLLLATVLPASAGNPNPGVLPGFSMPHGKSYSEWSAAWWHWAAETPAPVNALADPTGAYCASGQTGKVWFLAGTFGSDSAERSCTVPPGTALYFPIMNVFWGFLPSDPGPHTEAAARAYVDCTYSGLWAEIDGAALTLSSEKSSQYYEESPVFSVQLPADNIFGVTDPTQLVVDPMVDAGHYLFLAPLTPGEHTLRWGGAVSCPAMSLTATQNVTYDLTIK